jgi:hypothetical protein
VSTIARKGVPNVREPLVAWAGDCVVRGSIDVVDGRLSDQVNDLDLLTFFDATLEALDDGHQVLVGELEVERRELHLIGVNGRRGDPTRRLRTVPERVALQVGPFFVTGNLHRSPSAQPLASLNSWARFVPVTDAVIEVGGNPAEPVHEDVILVNRERISASRPLSSIASRPGDPWEDRPGASA